jgi:hypothetical protein
MTETPANPKSPDWKMKNTKRQDQSRFFFNLRSSKEKLKDPYANFMHHWSNSKNLGTLYWHCIWNEYSHLSMVLKKVIHNVYQVWITYALYKTDVSYV